MSRVDDILFAPISQSKVDTADFLVRKNVALNYDWKPQTRRAHEWLQNHFARPYWKSRVLDGWMQNISVYPNAGPRKKHRYAFEREIEHFIFEVIDT